MKFWTRRDDSLDREIGDHIERLTEEYLRAGLSPADARLKAERSFGRVLSVKEETRAVWGWVWLERLGQDLRYGLRTLRREPRFAAIVILSIAIGVGANTAIFSFADALLLRPLNVPHPSELLVAGSVSAVQGLGGSLNVSYPDYVDLRDRNQSFDGLAALGEINAAFGSTAAASPKVAVGETVSANFFDVLGVPPVLGRGFRADEDSVPGRDAVVVLGYELWQRELGGDPATIGGRIFLNGIPFTVVGIAPQGFTTSRYVQTSFYVPLAMEPALLANATVLEARDVRNLRLKGRLRAGVNISQARADLAIVADALAREYPATNANRPFVIRTELGDRVASDRITSTLMLMLGALALVVLAVACANVGGLIESRAPVRAREVAMRLAIGASRARIVRQLVTEHLLIALIGGVFGLSIGYAGVRLSRSISVPTDLPLSLSFELNTRVLVASLIAAVLSALAFGLAPAIRCTRTSLTAAMKPADSTHRKRQWGQSLLVAGQVALSVMLLVIALATYRAFSRELLVGPGYRTDHLLIARVDPQLVGYTEQKAITFYEQLLERVRAVPGVQSATITSRMPMGFSGGSAPLVPEGFELPQGTDFVNVLSAHVDESYFATLATPIVEGRAFRRDDEDGGTLVAIVNERFAKRYWPRESAVGRRFHFRNAQGPLVEIVGVARNSKYVFIAEPPSEFVYLPRRQHRLQEMTLLVESAGDPASLSVPIREVVHGLDANMPIADMRTMQAFYDGRAVSTGRVLVQMVASMGLMGLGLSIVGVYGLVACAASRRTREIGIRMAIGADRQSVLRMVIAQGVRLAVVGLVVGLPAGVMVQRLMQAIFPAQTGFDLMPLFVVVPAVLAVTTFASYVPARRAASLDALKALRTE